MTENGMIDGPGKRYYLGRITKDSNHRIVKRKMKKIDCSDGKTRRFCDGVDDSKTFYGRCLPVICAECGYDFNFFTIYDQTMPTLINHICKEVE